MNRADHCLHLHCRHLIQVKSQQSGRLTEDTAVTALICIEESGCMGAEVTW